MPLAISKLISPTSLGNPLCSAVKRRQWPPFEAGLEGGPSPLISPADNLNERGQPKYLSLLLQGGGRRRMPLLPRTGRTVRNTPPERQNIAPSFPVEGRRGAGIYALTSTPTSNSKTISKYWRQILSNKGITLTQGDNSQTKG